METFKEAEEKFEAALKEFMEFQGHGEGILIDWVLITANHTQEEDGSSTTNALYGPAHQSLYRAAGLVEYAKVKVRQHYTQD